MLVSNPQRFVIIPKIDEKVKFVIAHQGKENISPKETIAITKNGVSNITPSEGYNAMREVEVDVNVAMLKIEPIKQVTFNDNTTTIITPSEGYDAIESVGIVVDLTEKIEQEITNALNEIEYGTY